MEEFLAFIEEIGKTVDGNYIYRFYFTTDTDLVWGEFFNVVPSAIIPNIQVDKNSVSSSAKAVFSQSLILAKRNYCFSMQDCIDGIIPLCFAEICENTIEIDSVPFFLNFGEPIENVEKKLGKIGIQLTDKEEIEKEDNLPITNPTTKLDDENNNFDDLDF